jgi:hypothetical protein
LLCAPADPQGAGGGAVAARFTQGFGDPPGLGEGHPVPQGHGPPSAALARLFLEVAEL